MPQISNNENTGSGNGLVSSGIKPLPGPMFTQICVAIGITRPQWVETRAAARFHEIPSDILNGAIRPSDQFLGDILREKLKAESDILHEKMAQWKYIKTPRTSSKPRFHYDDVTMTLMASQITSLTIVYSTVYSGADQRKHQSSTALAFVRGIHRGPVNSPHKWPVTRKMSPFDDVIMLTQKRTTSYHHCPLWWSGLVRCQNTCSYSDDKVRHLKV